MSLFSQNHFEDDTPGKGVMAPGEPRAPLEGHHFDFEGRSIPIHVYGRRKPGAERVVVKCSRCECVVEFPAYSAEDAPVYEGPRVCPGTAPEGEKP